MIVVIASAVTMVFNRRKISVMSHIMHRSQILLLAKIKKGKSFFSLSPFSSTFQHNIYEKCSIGLSETMMPECNAAI